MCVRAVVVVASVLGASALVAACGGSSSSGEADSTARVASASPRYGGQVILGIGADPSTFNSPFVADIVSGALGKLVHASLLYTNERSEMVPSLAVAEPEVTEDGTVWTVRLRPRVMFHDGAPLTAADVAFTYGILIDPDYAGLNAGRFRMLASIDAVDEHTVQFRLKEASASFGALLDLNVLPKHLLGHIPVAELGDYRSYNVDRPIGAGPFELVSRTPGESLVFEAFEGYFEGRPYLDRVTVRVVPNQSTGVLQLATGEIDVITIPLDELPTVESMTAVAVHSIPMLNFNFIAWNLRNPLFADRRVRQALTHAVDREAIVETLLRGRAVVAHAPIPPLIGWAYTDDVPKFPYDPQRAKNLLDEAGWTKGVDGVLQRDGRRFAFELLIGEGISVHRDVAVVAQQYLREVGVDVRVTALELRALLERIDPPRFEFDAYVLGMNIQTDPDPRVLWHSAEIDAGMNNGAFRHAHVDELADLNIRLMDRGERAAVLKEIWRILAEEQPNMFLFFPEAFYGVRADVRSFKPHPRLITHRANEWWLDR